VEAWAHPQIALRWSERHLAAEVELARGMLADLDALPAAPPDAPEVNADQDAPTTG
jgi:hypothetical protein